MLSYSTSPGDLGDTRFANVIASIECITNDTVARVSCGRQDVVFTYYTTDIMVFEIYTKSRKGCHSSRQSFALWQPACMCILFISVKCTRLSVVLSAEKTKLRNCLCLDKFICTYNSRTSKQDWFV